MRVVSHIVETFAHLLLQDSSVTNAAFLATQCHVCHICVTPGVAFCPLLAVTNLHSSLQACQYGQKVHISLQKKTQKCLYFYRFFRIRLFKHKITQVICQVCQSLSRCRKAQLKICHVLFDFISCLLLNNLSPYKNGPTTL